MRNCVTFLFVMTRVLASTLTQKASGISGSVFFFLQTFSSTEEATVAFAGGKKQEATAGENSPSQFEGPQKKKARKEQMLKFRFGDEIQTQRITIPATMDAVIDAATKLFDQFESKSWKIVYNDEDG